MAVFHSIARLLSNGYTREYLCLASLLNLLLKWSVAAVAAAAVVAANRVTSRGQEGEGGSGGGKSGVMVPSALLISLSPISNIQKVETELSPMNPSNRQLFWIVDVVGRQETRENPPPPNIPQDNPCIDGGSPPHSGISSAGRPWRITPSLRSRLNVRIIDALDEYLWCDAFDLWPAGREMLDHHYLNGRREVGVGRGGVVSVDDVASDESNLLFPSTCNTCAGAWSMAPRTRSLRFVNFMFHRRSVTRF